MELKAARLAKGLSQRALSEGAGVPQSHISKIERGGVDLRHSSLVEIARALDLEVTLVPAKALIGSKVDYADAIFGHGRTGSGRQGRQAPWASTRHD